MAPSRVDPPYSSIIASMDDDASERPSPNRQLRGNYEDLILSLRESETAAGSDIQNAMKEVRQSEGSIMCPRSH